jgi:TPP-dependent pyruvate/acetoin dehydrogenase alpha subunit
MTPECGLPVQARDPIPQFRKYVLDNNILSEEQVKDIEKDVIAVVEEAVKVCRREPQTGERSEAAWPSLWSSPVTQSVCFFFWRAQMPLQFG